MTDYICTNCEYVGKRKEQKRGSLKVEIFLWLVLLIPGPFYSIWRIFNKIYSCPQCGFDIMIPADSVLGQRKLKQIESELSHKELSKIPDIWEKDRKEYSEKKVTNKDSNDGGDKW